MAIYWDRGKIVALLKIITLTVPILIVDLIWKLVSLKLKLRQPPRLSAPLRLSANMWSIEYFTGIGEISAQTIVVRNSSGQLLLISPMAPTDEAVRILETLGKVTLVVVPNQGHDSNSHKWSEKFPSCASACFEAQRAQLAEYKPPRICTTTCEEALVQWGITAYPVPGLGCLNGTPFFEAVLEVPMEGGGVAMVFSDMIQNHQHKSLYLWFFSIVSGWYGLGHARFFRAMFLRDFREVSAFINKVLLPRPNVQMCVFLHGLALKGDRCMIEVAKSIA